MKLFCSCRSELEVKLSLGLLDLRVNQQEVWLLSRATQSLLDTAAVCMETLGGDNGGKAVGKSPSSMFSTREFRDDLRVLGFAYVMDKSPGEWLTTRWALRKKRG
jgi:hypothetical protein